MKDNNGQSKCFFCDEPTYQLCKVETVGFPDEKRVIRLCFKHFNQIAKVLPYTQMELIK